MMKATSFLAVMALSLLLVSGVQAYTWEEIDLEGTYGSGDNSALLVIDFSTIEDDSFAWEINFSDATVTVYDMLSTLDIYDPDFSFSMNAGDDGPINTITYGSYSAARLPPWYGYSSSDLGESWTNRGIAQGDLTIGNDGTFGLLFTSAGFSNTPETPTVPLPAAVWLLGGGLLALIGIRRRTVK
jgi:hypothetical protein